MLPFLAQLSRKVVAMDVDLLPLECLQKHIGLPANVRVVDAARACFQDLVGDAFDLVVALDVLEHVEDLSHTIAQLLELLKPGGQLVVSGPTENTFYKIGRKLAGQEYSGAYHLRGIAEIRRSLAPLVRVQHIATLYWPIPLFQVFAATPCEQRT